MRSDVNNSYEELERELLEYLAMIDQKNRTAIGNLNSVAGQCGSQRPRGGDLRVQRASVGMTRTKGCCCALSVMRVLSKIEKYRRKLGRPHLTMSALAKERARARAKKGKGRTCYNCGEQGHFARVSSF